MQPTLRNNPGTYHLWSTPYQIILMISTSYSKIPHNDTDQVDALAQDCSISITNVLQVPESYTKPWKYSSDI